MEIGEVSRDSLAPVGKKTYEVEGNSVRLGWKIFEPTEVLGSQETSNGKKAIVYLPGWSYTEKAKSTEILSQTFADYSHSPTFVVDTRTEQIVPDFLGRNAEAVRQFIQEKGLKDLTIVGNSLGGAEAIHLVASLQERNPDIKISGLILLDSVSLYNQTAAEIAVNWARDLTSTLNNLRNPPKFTGDDELVRQNIKYLQDGTIEILKEVMRSHLISWPKREINELRAMAKTNPRLGHIKSPIVLIQGAHDLLSKPSEIIPKSPQDTAKDYIEDTKAQEREQYLRENIFTNSPYVRMIVPEKMGHHNVSYSRPESVAKTSLYLLKRWHRQKA